MEETAKMENCLSSAAAFVEGGVQDACDDSCSICLESFLESDPSSVTSCKHEFHLQCILEWCQRSSQCPMCWQPLSLKDPTSQELFEAVEHERSIRSNRTPSTAIFHQSALGDFGLQHLPEGANVAEIEERIIQHLAAAAAMGRAHDFVRRERQRIRSAGQGYPQYLVFSTHQNTPSVGSISASSTQRGESDSASVVDTSSPSPTHIATDHSPQHQLPDISLAETEQVTGLSPGADIASSNRPGLSNSWISAGQSSPVGQDRAGPSDLQAFSESLKSRLNAVSLRYKESITKSTRGWREKLFSRSTTVADIGSEVRRDVSAGIATVSRMIERLDTRESRKTASGSAAGNSSAMEPTIESEVGSENNTTPLPNDNNTSTSCAATSSPN